MRYTLLLFFAVTAALASFTSFPEDPSGAEVIDRAFFREMVDGEECVVYLIMYNRGNQGVLDVISATPSSGAYRWETVFSWKPSGYDSTPLSFDPLSVISTQRSGNSLVITWIDQFSDSYIEGLATLYLDYNLQWKGAEEFWSD